MARNKYSARAVVTRLEDDITPFDLSELIEIINNDNQITILNLNLELLEIDHITPLLQAIKVNNNIQSLTLKFCNMDFFIAPLVRDIVNHNTTITHLDLSECSLNPHFANLIFGNVKSKSLSEINLSGNPLSNTGLEIVLEFARRSPNLTNIIVKSCFIDSQGALTLAHYIASDNKLEGLVISDNDIDFVGSSAIADSMKHNRTLNYLDLSNNPLDKPNAYEEWQQVIISNKNILCLGLDDCGLKVDFEGHILPHLFANRKNVARLGMELINQSNITQVTESINFALSASIKEAKASRKTQYAFVEKLISDNVTFTRLTNGQIEALKVRKSSVRHHINMSLDKLFPGLQGVNFAELLFEAASKYAGENWTVLLGLTGKNKTVTSDIEGYTYPRHPIFDFKDVSTIIGKHIDLLNDSDLVRSKVNSKTTEEVIKGQPCSNNEAARVHNIDQAPSPCKTPTKTWEKRVRDATPSPSKASPMKRCITKISRIESKENQSPNFNMNK